MVRQPGRAVLLFAASQGGASLLGGTRLYRQKASCKKYPERRRNKLGGTYSLLTTSTVERPSSFCGGATALSIIKLMFLSSRELGRFRSSCDSDAELGGRAASFTSVFSRPCSCLPRPDVVHDLLSEPTIALKRMIWC